LTTGQRWQSTQATVEHEDRRSAVIAVLLVLASVGAASAISALVLAGRPQFIAGFGLLLLPLVFWRFPRSPVVVIVLMATLVEQYPVGYADLTDHLPLFKSLSDAGGLSGVYINPAEIVLLIAVAVWLLRAINDRQLRLPRNQLAFGVGVLLLVVALAELHGLVLGGDFKRSLWEVRPWAYLALLYFLGSQLIPARQAFATVAWPFVIGSGLKGIQGSLAFLAHRGVFPRPDNILSHDESVFFGVFIALTLALWVFGHKGRLKLVATALLPFVVVADLANSRRTAWLILPACLAVLAVLAWARSTAGRGRLAGLLTLAVVGVGLYLPLYWNGGGTIAQPARAIRSAIYPSSRDASSDTYRQIEDTNLWANIRVSPIWGTGFGIPIFEVVPNVDLSNIDSSIKYIQHNQILYFWWRTGTSGALAFWWVIGSAMIVACRLARSPDPKVAMLGTLAALGLVAYLIQADYDMGLTSFRLQFLVGSLLAAMEAVRSGVLAAEVRSPARRVVPAPANQLSPGTA
jgi:hypothetical protein